MELKIEQDKINKTHYHVFLNKLELGSVHGPGLKGDYMCYVRDNVIEMKTYKTFDECLHYIKSYIQG